MIDSWLYDPTFWDVVGGLTILCYGLGFVIWVLVAYGRRVHTTAWRIAEKSDRVEELRLELPLVVPAAAIGTASWVPVYFFHANAEATIAINAGVAYFSLYVINVGYSKGFLQKVRNGDLDEKKADEQLGDDVILVASERALLAGIGIGVVLAHMSFGATDTQIEMQQADLSIFGALWRLFAFPFAVFWAMVVAGKMDTVWSPRMMFRREMRRWRRRS